MSSLKLLTPLGIGLIFRNNRYIIDVFAIKSLVKYMPQSILL